MPFVAPLAAEDQPRWHVLARGYKAFYETPLPDAAYDTAWRRIRAGDGIHALGVRLDGELVAIAHFLFHGNTWSADVCYLQDLYVDEAFRGRGAARALIDAVAQRAREQQASRLYWLTHNSNSIARALYDSVAVNHGFIRYDHPLMTP